MLAPVLLVVTDSSPRSTADVRPAQRNSQPPSPFPPSPFTTPAVETTRAGGLLPAPGFNKRLPLDSAVEQNHTQQGQPLCFPPVLTTRARLLLAVTAAAAAYAILFLFLPSRLRSCFRLRLCLRLPRCAVQRRARRVLR